MVECNHAGVPHPCSHVRTLSTAHLVFLPNFARCDRRIPASSLVPISGWLSSIATFEGVGFTPLSSNVSAAAAVVAVGAVGAASCDSCLILSRPFFSFLGLVPNSSSASSTICFFSLVNLLKHLLCALSFGLLLLLN